MFSVSMGASLLRTYPPNVWCRRFTPRTNLESPSTTRYAELCGLQLRYESGQWVPIGDVRPASVPPKGGSHHPPGPRSSILHGMCGFYKLLKSARSAPEANCPQKTSNAPETLLPFYWRSRRKDSNISKIAWRPIRPNPKTPFGGANLPKAQTSSTFPVTHNLRGGL